MSMDIVIDDPRHPVLSDVQKAGHAWGEANPVSFSTQAMLDETRRRTGFSDFGPQNFLERLNMLVDEWNADPGVAKSTATRCWDISTAMRPTGC